MAAELSVNHYLAHLGLQLWTVRDQLEKDMLGTLRAVQAAGYAQIELLNTISARAIDPPARELGLRITSAFMDWEALVQPDVTSEAKLTDTVKIGRELGLQYLVFGYIGKGSRETMAQMKQHAASANAFGRQCRDAGLQLCYHHHSFEFAPLADGTTTGWDILVGELDPALVQFELDVFWAAIAGRDPIRLLQELRGRVAQVHLKDLPPGLPLHWDENAVAPEVFKEVGLGCLDFKKILATSVATGVAQCHVEQDQSPDPLVSIATSFNYLQSVVAR